tara:strand:- start:14787 stop:15632 length:846 start_codon:yes stop_codon:yes gene_type:complete
MKIKFIILIFLLVSCSYTKKDDLSSPVATSFDIDEETSEALPKLRKNISTKGIGPVPSHEYIGKKSGSNRKAVVGLYLAPGKYRTLSYLPILNSMKQSNIEINIISAGGFSTIIASLYAQGVKPDLIEWEMHKLLSPIEEEPFQEDWLSIVHDWIEEKFKNRKIESGGITLALATSDALLLRGDLVQTLKNNIAKGETGPMEVVEQLKELGSDIVICLNAAGESLDNSQIMREKCDLYVDSNHKDFKMNDKLLLTDILAESAKSSYSIAKQIENVIEEWKK